MTTHCSPGTGKPVHRTARRPSTYGRSSIGAAQPPGQSSAAHLNNGEISAGTTNGAATRSPPRRPGNSRRPSSAGRFGPPTKQVGKGWVRKPADDRLSQAIHSAPAGVVSGCSTGQRDRSWAYDGQKATMTSYGPLPARRVRRTPSGSSSNVNSRGAPSSRTDEPALTPSLRTSGV